MWDAVGPCKETSCEDVDIVGLSDLPVTNLRLHGSFDDLESQLRRDFGRNQTIHSFRHPCSSAGMLASSDLQYDLYCFIPSMLEGTDLNLPHRELVIFLFQCSGRVVGEGLDEDLG
jgi:hypothetical protein